MTNVTEEVGADLLHLMAGALIGEGQYRTVYQSNFNAGQVIKHDNCLNWSNVNEFWKSGWHRACGCRRVDSG
jgi:hypothetical protein